MKSSLIISSILHITLIGWGLVSLSPPKKLNVAQIDALPIDIIPIETLTKSQIGKKTTKLKKKSNVDPTKNKKNVTKAQTVGENKVDIKAPPVPKKRPVKTTAAVPKQQKQTKKADAPVSEPVKPKVSKPIQKTEPAVELASKPEPKSTVPTPDPLKQIIAKSESLTPKFKTLPDTIPIPKTKPKKRTIQTAKTPKRINKQKNEPTSASTKKTEKTFDTDVIKALLNKQKEPSGGAKRSTETASLGLNKTNSTDKLSQSEMDALRGQIQKCWSIVPGLAGAENVRIRVSMRLTKTGTIDGNPNVEAIGGPNNTRRTFSEGARRAVIRCAPYNLPKDKYHVWSDVIVNFDPSEMF